MKYVLTAAKFDSEVFDSANPEISGGYQDRPQSRKQHKKLQTEEHKNKLVVT